MTLLDGTRRYVLLGDAPTDGGLGPLQQLIAGDPEWIWTEDATIVPRSAILEARIAASPWE